MKREIIFRGKDVETGEWVEGYYVLFPTPCIYNPKTGEWHKVHPETVGQYVNTKDKTGKKVFEGDIVEAWSAGSHTTHGLVKWGSTGFFILLLGEKGPTDHWDLAPHSERMKGYELIDEHLTLIGNVIDNPELLPCPNRWKEF